MVSNTEFLPIISGTTDLLRLGGNDVRDSIVALYGWRIWSGL